MHPPASRRRTIWRALALPTALFVLAGGMPVTAFAAVGPDSTRRSSDSLAARRTKPAPDGTTVTPRAEGEPSMASWRAQLERHGVTLALSHITDATNTPRALTARRSVRTYGNAGVTVHMDSLLPLRGLTVFVQYAAKSGRDLSADAAMIQNFSNIDAPDFAQFAEVWAEQRLFGDRVRVKAGRLDFNQEFAGTVAGGNFLNASMGYSPSIAAAPTYPLPSPGANLFVSPVQSLSVGVGVFSGIDGAAAAPGRKSLFEIVQATQQWTLPGRALAGQFGAGSWRHTGLFPAIDAPADAAPVVSNIRGWFTTLDQELWHGAVPEGSDATPSTIAAFAQAGRADPRARTVYTHAGGGLTFAGIVPHRAGDVVGIGATRASSRDGREVIREAFYLLPITSHLSLAADLQHVARHDWGAGATLRSGTVSTLRTTIQF